MMISHAIYTKEDRNIIVKGHNKTYRLSRVFMHKSEISDKNDYKNATAWCNTSEALKTYQ